MDGYSVPFCFDRNGNGGDILFCMPSKLLSMDKNIEGFFVKINLRKKNKWLLSCSYNPTKMQISNDLAELSKRTALYLTKYDQLLFLGGLMQELKIHLLKIFVLIITLQV